MWQDPRIKRCEYDEADNERMDSELKRERYQRQHADQQTRNKGQNKAKQSYSQCYDKNEYEFSLRKEL